MKDNVLGEMYEKKLIPRMEEFKNLSNQKFNNKSIILDKNTDINSYSQLLDSLKGNAFIIDFWGSWCLPCQYQFQFTKKLKRLLKKHNIKMVYISKEYTNSREKWENLIKNYNLEGYHFICNKKFIEDFEQKVSKI